MQESKIVKNAMRKDRNSKNRWSNVQEGYLTVVLSLILSIMLSMCLVLICGARDNMRRLHIECVTDICMNSILAEYHRELLNQYDLLFIDTSYGTAVPSYDKTAVRLIEYLAHNLNGEDIFLEFVYRDASALEVQGVAITEVSGACDDGGKVLRRQTVDIMKQQIGLTYLEQIADWCDTVKAYELDTRDVLAEQRIAVAELESWETASTADGEGASGIDIPGEHIVSFWESGMLGLLVDDTASLSGRSIHTENYISAREPLQGTGINPEVTFADNFVEQLLFHEYILAYTGRFDAQKEDGFLKYQTEYILAGNDSDLQNIKDIVYRLLAIRAAANLVYLVSDSEKMKLAEVTAGALALLIALPELTSVFQAVLVLTWALAESIYDVAQLLDGNRVALLKTGDGWHYSLENMLAFEGSLITQKTEIGLSYADYLRILLCLQDKEVTTFRLMDIMEMDIRQTPGNASFRMDACIDSFCAEILFSAAGEKEPYSITRRYGY